MKRYIYQHFLLSLLLIICCTSLVGCGLASPEARENSPNSTLTNDTSTNVIEESVTSSATMITMATTQSTIQETETPTPAITQQPVLVATITPTPTVTLFPSPTPTSEPSPTVRAVECKNNGSGGEVSDRR